MRRPQTTGEELPGPGKGAFQRTLSLRLHLRGGVLAAASPEPSPRQPGQLSAGKRAAQANNSTQATILAVFIPGPQRSSTVRRQTVGRVILYMHLRQHRSAWLEALLEA